MIGARPSRPQGAAATLDEPQDECVRMSCMPRSSLPRVTIEFARDEAVVIIDSR
jgi:hypothetical protein